MAYEQVGSWGIAVVKKALRHADVEVRDAAIRALEAWGGNESLQILQLHRDPVGWINNYLLQVIADLTEDRS
jgi:hypothetical protein